LDLIRFKVWPACCPAVRHCAKLEFRSGSLFSHGGKFTACPAQHGAGVANTPPGSDTRPAFPDSGIIAVSGRLRPGPPLRDGRDPGVLLSWSARFGLMIPREHRPQCALIWSIYA